MASDTAKKHTAKETAAEPRAIPDASAKKQLETLEQRVAFLEQRLGLTKTIQEHEFEATTQMAPEQPRPPHELYVPGEPDGE